MLVGSHLGQYRIVRKIGAGGMGNVFLGEHTLLGRRAAIKTLLPALSSNREIVERFFNEARATSSIADPGIVQVFDFGYHVDGTAYIVMELLEGEALSARIDRLGKLPVAEALRIARQGAGSLAAAHAHTIVHRDLKPQNVFLVRDSEAAGGERTKILDFGICKQGGTGDPSLTESGAMIGTPVYMSPEQCRGLGEIDHRSDVYAFGCLMFHMLTGRPPFVGEAPGDLIVAHLKEPPPAPSEYVPELPPSVDALLAKCLAKEVAERFQSMSELKDAIDEVLAHLDDAPVVATPPRPTLSLGSGFRSVFQGNLASPPPNDNSPIPKTPKTFVPELSRRMMQETPLPYVELDELPAQRSGFRTFLAVTAIAGMIALLIVGSVVLGNDDAVAQARPVAPLSAQAVTPVEATVEQRSIDQSIEKPSDQSIEKPTNEPIEKPIEAPVVQQFAEQKPAPTIEPDPVAVAPTPAPAVQEAIAPAPRETATRASTLVIKKKPTRPRARPPTQKPEPASHPTEDLYDSR